METVYAEQVYQWECPQCGFVEETNADPEGEWECPACKEKVKVMT